MKYFKCFIAGENFPGQLIGQSKKIGFYTTRFVKAKTENEAESMVLDALRSDPGLRLPKDVVPENDAKVYFEKIVEVSMQDVPKIQSGFTFYVMGT